MVKYIWFYTNGDELLVGLFSKEKKCCSICGGKTGLGYIKFTDCILCNSCFRKVYKT